jgi:hypothetical protein
MKIIKTAKYIKLSEDWKDIPGEFNIEIAVGEFDELYDISHDRDISERLESEITRIIPLDIIKQQGNIELSVDFKSSGMDEPASMHGGPDHLGWPAQNEEERLVKKVSVFVNGKVVGVLNPEANGIIEQEYAREINDIGIDHDSEDLRGDYEYDLSKDEPGRFDF